VFCIGIIFDNFDAMKRRRLSAWILMVLVAMSSGTVQAFVHVCSNQGPQWSESSCSTDHYEKSSCCSKKASVQPKSCCESVYLFGLSAKYKDRIPQQQSYSPERLFPCASFIDHTIIWANETPRPVNKVPFPPPDGRALFQRNNQ
jgi:hypothetical protein